MTMQSSAALIALLIALCIYYLVRRNRQVAAKISVSSMAVSQPDESDLGVLISGRHLDHMPPSAQPWISNNSAVVERGRQLAGDLFKGAATTANKTVELAFDPHIKQGLLEGTLEVVPAKGGGLRLMAREVDSGRFAGHGRILENGRARQLMSGAFHLLSIAVAQSHLADINRSLDSIRQSVNMVLTDMENQELAQLRGNLEYLDYLANYIKQSGAPDQIPLEKKTQLEQVCRETMMLSEKLLLDIQSRNNQIIAQVDIDSVGSGSTFVALQTQANAVRALTVRRELLVRTMMILNVMMAYLDPAGVSPSGLSFLVERDSMERQIEVMGLLLRDRVNQLLSKAVFNTQSTIIGRRTMIISDVEDILTQTRVVKQEYDRATLRIQDHIGRFQRDGKIRLAMKFDAHGDVEALAMI